MTVLQRTHGNWIFIFMAVVWTCHLDIMYSVVDKCASYHIIRKNITRLLPDLCTIHFKASYLNTHTIFLLYKCAFLCPNFRTSENIFCLCTGIELMNIGVWNLDRIFFFFINIQFNLILSFLRVTNRKLTVTIFSLKVIFKERKSMNYFKN